MSPRSYIVDALRSPVTRQWWPWIAASPFIIVLCDYLAVAPIGSQIFLWFKAPFILGYLAAILAGFVLPFLLMVRRLRKAALAWLLASLCFLPLAFGGIILGKKVRISAFHGLAGRSAPLVSAVYEYIDDHEVPPESLNQLVPAYLGRIPKTGIMEYPEYRYKVGQEAERFEGNPWVISVFTPSGGINFDEFFYFPLQNYPDHGHGGSFQRIRQWAYLHE